MDNRLIQSIMNYINHSLKLHKIPKPEILTKRILIL